MNNSSLMSTVGGIAAKIGAPIVKQMIEKKLGKTGGAVADTIIDMIAERAGVPVDSLPHASPDKLETAIREVELVAPEVILAHVSAQESAHSFMVAEMNKGSLWTWAWRPAFMWAILAFWVWVIILMPALNAVTGAKMVMPYMEQMLTISLAYLGLYMGGHTAKQFVKGKSDG